MHRVVRVLPDSRGETLLLPVLSGSSALTVHKVYERFKVFKVLLCCCQVYKFIYANRLLDCGLSSQAFHYCELVGEALLRQRKPFTVLAGEVIKVHVLSAFNA